MESRRGAVYCTGGNNYSDRHRAAEWLSLTTHGLAFDFVSDCFDKYALRPEVASWPDSRLSSRWHSPACYARLPPGTTDRIDFSPLVEGLW